MSLILYIQFDNLPTEIMELYLNRISLHNNNFFNSSTPDSGFDLLIPTNNRIINESLFIDFKIKCALFDNNQNKFKGFYLYPRSSIYKTPLRLANSVGIIDSGYRGTIKGFFDFIHNNNNNEYILEDNQRLVQICSGSLEPFIIQVIENISNLGQTQRGENGFGSTN
jgi:dUTP pyrophosphatase